MGDGEVPDTNRMFVDSSVLFLGVEIFVVCYGISFLSDEEFVEKKSIISNNPSYIASLRMTSHMRYPLARIPVFFSSFCWEFGSRMISLVEG